MLALVCPVALLGTALAAPRPLADSARALDALDHAQTPVEARAAHLDLARALATLGLPLAARLHLLAALDGPVSTAAERRLTERALAGLLAQEPVLSDPALIAATATLPADPLAPALQPAVHTLHAWGALAAGASAEAQAALALAHTAEADLLQGLLASERGAPRTAARHLLRAREQAADPRRPQPALYDLATLDLARLLHAHGRLRPAADLYRELDPSRPDWARAREELAWTLLLAGERPQALGAALALRSARGEVALEPSAQLVVGILRAEACHWDAAAGTAESLIAGLEPHLARLDRWLDHPRPAEAWADPELHPGLRTAAHRDALLHDVLEQRSQLQRERARLAAQRADWAETVGVVVDEALLGELARLDGLAAARSLVVLGRERARLQSVVDDARVLAFEVSEAERHDLEQRARGGVEDPEPVAVDWATATEVVAWPFNGEFWEDELDAYSVELRAACPLAG